MCLSTVYKELQIILKRLMKNAEIKLLFLHNHYILSKNVQGVFPESMSFICLVQE